MLEHYLEHGYNLIRLKEDSKLPVQSWNVGEPHEVLRRHKGNYGVLTGDSGIVVLDVDTHGENPKEGYDSLSKMFDEYGELPDTFLVTTPTNGEHIYFKLPDYAKDWEFHKQLDDYPSLDFQNGKTYVLAAGSQIGGKSYQVRNLDLESVSEAPEWLLRLYKRKAKTHRPNYRKNALGSFLEEIFIGSGEGSRNVWLTKVCGTLFRSGANEKVIYSWLHQVNSMACQPPLHKGEVDTIYRSILRSEQTNRGRKDV